MFTTLSGLFVVALVFGVLFFLARRILRLALKLALVGAVVFALLVGGLFGWWRGWFDWSSHPARSSSPLTPQKSPSRRPTPR
ncbi:MAG: hypothetical protein ABR607_02325 [Pyrinomonadaceae bacterium]